MNDEIIAALNALNRRFYRERASEFSATRERPWKGWSELFDRHRDLVRERPAVLDVGCGNGRFARFLEAELGFAFTYLGIDESPLALEEARRRLGSREGVVLARHDFIESDSALPPSRSEDRFDLVVLFGVVHHVPGAEKRKELLSRLSGHVAPGGILVYTLWRFDRHERFRKKIVPWRELAERTGVSIDVDELEPGDAIVTWGSDPPGLRYCHAASDEEVEALARSIPLTRVAIFDAEDEPNTYCVFRRVEQTGKLLSSSMAACRERSEHGPPPSQRAGRAEDEGANDG